VTRMLRVSSAIVIDEAELVERFVRASGPGGQNVNKVASAVQLRFDVRRSPALSDEIRTGLETIAGSRITVDGILVIDARRFRTQAENRRDARERLVALIREAAIRPKRRHKTRPSASAVERRIATKRRRSDAKHRRGRVSGDD
jgi:ribosome-associated protein